VYGREQALMEQVLARRELDKELAEFTPPNQILHIDLDGRDPDEGTTHVPYVKGSLLLRQMEQVFGREAFDSYLRRYFDHFAFQSITTTTMLEHLQQELFNSDEALAAQIPVRQWIYEPGMPEQAPRAVSQRLQAVSAAAGMYATFISGFGMPAPKGLTVSASSSGAWSSQEWLEFLQVLPPLNAGQMAQLDEAFHLTQSGNYEILDQWLQMAIKADYRAAYPRVEAFLLEVGRGRFIKPLYTELMKTPDGQDRARAIYAKARALYHPIAQTAVDKIVGKAG
jgi:leukotriene-A4 hydrolase